MTAVDLTNEKAHEPIINSIEHPGSERNILAYIIHNPDAVYDVVSKLREEDFNNTLNRLIYQVMCRLSEKGVPVTTENILAVTRGNSVLDKQGEEYLARISLVDATRIDLDHNINLVQAASVKRQAYRESLRVIKDCIEDEDTDDANDFIGRQQKRFIDLGMGVINDGVVHLGEGVKEWIEERKNNPNPVPGLSTGYKELDEAIGGLRKGRLYVWAARSKSRKSLMLTNIAAHIAYKTQVPILYLDTEMTSFEDVRPRILAIVSGVPEDEITKGTFVYNPQYVEAVKKAADIVEKGPFYHAYLPSFSTTQVSNIVRKYHLKYKIGIFFFDYIKMPLYGDSRLQEYQLLGQLTGVLKDLAGELGVPCVTAAQLNRGAVGVDGDNEDDFDESMVAGSDRILHNASYLFYQWMKSPKRIAEDGVEAGNLCVKLGHSRHGGEYFGWYKAHDSNARISEIMNVAR